MQKAVRVAAVLVLAGGLAYWLIGREPADTGPAEVREEVASAAPGGAAPPTRGGASASSRTAKGQTGAAAGPARLEDDSRTPPLENPATAADGFAELHVLAGTQAVAGARVTLYLRTGTRRGPASFRIAGAGVTGRDGIVKLPARPGRYLASAHAPSFAPAEKEFVRPEGAHLTAVELKLPQGHTLRGRVVSRDGGEPVAQAKVTAGNALPPAGGFRGGGGPRVQQLPPEERAAAESGVDGRFQLTGLAAGTYAVEATSVGHSHARTRAAVPREGELLLELPAAAVIEGRVLTSSGSPASGAEVTAMSNASGKAMTFAAQGGGFSLEVEPGTHHLTAQLAPEAGAQGEPIAVAAGRTVRGVVIQLGAAASVAGTVFAQSSGRPLPGASVTLVVSQSASIAGLATTDGAGTFSIGGLAPGSYDAAIHADSYTDVLRRGVTVAAGQVFPLQAGLTGTGSVAGLVADSAGRPLPGAVVQLTGGFGPGGLTGAQAEAVTGTDGRYRLDNLSPGTVRLIAARDPSSFGPAKSVEITESQQSLLDFTLADNGVLTGHVRLKSGGPPDATATVVRALQQGDMGGFRDGSVLGTGQLDPGGGYQLSLPPGVYRVMATGGTGRQQPSMATVVANQPAQLDLTVDDTVAGTSGSVVEPSGAPSANARVALLSATRQTVGFAVADSEGNFTVSQFRGTPPASVRARNGGRIGEVPVTAGSDSTVVQLQGAATLHGTLASGGTPAISFTVTVAPVDTAAAMWDPGGGGQLEFAGSSFDLYDQPGVDVNVTVRTADGRSGTQLVPLRPGQSATATIALQDSAAVSGRIVNASGNVPVPNALVLLDGAARLGNASLAGQDGRFRLTGLSAGQHTLAVRAGQFNAPAQPITVTPGQALDMGDIVLPLPRTPPGTLGVRFFNANTGVAMGSVIPGGPADVAGIQEGDLLLTLDGVAVLTPADATARSAGPPGAPISVSFQHAGQAQTVQVFRAQ